MSPSEDRISSLSDEIISHILSFIPTKHAVTTSILSKRWMHLWHFIPLLNFTDIKFEDRESILQFNQFVYSVLLSRNTSGFHSINAFFLHIQYSNPNHLKLLSIPNLTTWVNHVVQRNVKHLHLLLHSLHNLDHDDDDDNDLDLDDDDDDRNYIPKLLISIFTCKTLVVLKLNWFSVQDFSFSSVGFEFPSLKTLHLSYIDFDEDRELMWLLAGCPVLEDFKASNVFVYFERRDRRNCKEFQNLNLSKLIRADVIHCMCYFPMKALFNSEFLRLQLREMYIPYDFPTFHNLTHLVINNDWEFVVQVLHHCPKLQNLDLHQKIRNNWVEPEFAPQCISLCLRTCTIREFRFVCLKRHIMLAKYILQNAGVLQTMAIWSDKEQHEIERELSSCPRASATCQLSVY